MNTKNSFTFLNIVQFAGALNDNVFKFLCLFYLIGLAGSSNSDLIGAQVTAIFVIPFLLFTPSAGVLADQNRKESIIKIVKAVELVIICFGSFAFYLHNTYLLYAALFLHSAQSAFFGPAKYGIIIELVGRKELSKANGIIDAFTYLAIIFGSILAPFVSELLNKNYFLASLSCVAIAVLGNIPAFFIKNDYQPNVNKKSLFSIIEPFKNLKQIADDRYLLMAVIGAAYFLFLAAFTQIYIISYGINILHLSQEQSAYIFMLGALGIGIGSAVAGYLSGKSVEFGIVPIGSLAITLAALGLATGVASISFTCLMSFMFGFGAGLFVIPLHSFVQLRAPDHLRAKIIATSGFFSWIGVLFSAVLAFIFSKAGLSPDQCFLIVGVITLLLSVITFIILPDFLLRFIIMILTRLFYKIRVSGSENIPTEGAALLVPNHVSYVDALIILATQNRRIRFIMWDKIFNANFIAKSLYKFMGVIPIKPGGTKDELEQSFTAAQTALAEGYVVCIFAEGALSRSGLISQFKSGFERITHGTNYPIIPMHIGGLWGSIFSFYHGSIKLRNPSKLPYPVTVSYGKLLSPDSNAAAVKSAVSELAYEYYNSEAKAKDNIAKLFIRSAKKNWKNKAVVDSSGLKLSYGKLLTISLLLSNKFLAGNKCIGIILPASVAACCANLSCLIAGKIPVNLNFTSSQNAINSALKQCEIETIITSKKFTEKIKLDFASQKLIYVEDLLSNLSKFTLFTTYIKCLIFPLKFLAKSAKADNSETATIIFSSGSTAEPKGVILSHHNLIYNVEALRSVFIPKSSDDIASGLPLFHSFGFTGSFLLPLLSGFSASYHMSPIEAGAIAKLVAQEKSSFLLATPSFLSAYHKKAKEEDFASLRIVITGAERLSQNIADSFYEKFKVTPLEGYGATELSPVASVNLPNISGTKANNKLGSAGLPLPGILLKIVDPESKEILTNSTEGLLLIKSPGCMQGYLNKSELTNSVLIDGWYNTGDIAKIDNNGFLHIIGRVSRFSKVAGEMVSHVAVEEAITTALNTEERLIAVGGTPDTTRGERIVIVYDNNKITSEKLLETINTLDIPNLWKAKDKDLIPVDSIPLLGTGKLDLAGINNLIKNYFTS